MEIKKEFNCQLVLHKAIKMLADPSAPSLETANKGKIKITKWYKFLITDTHPLMSQAPSRRTIN